MTPSKAERNAAYRAGLCVDCLTAPHSSGRPRCETCHTRFINPTLKEKP